MVKRAKKLQKQRRKNAVRKNVQKLKEITVQDIILNPAILHSPQFKALPIEKQYQLIEQVKQYMAYHKNPTSTIGSSSTGGANHDLYSTLMSTQQTLQKRDNEISALKTQIEANKAQIQELANERSNLLNLESNFERLLDRKHTIQVLKKKQEALKDKMDNGEINDLEKQLNLTEEQNRAAQLRRIEEQKARIRQRISRYNIQSNQSLTSPKSPSEALQRHLVENKIIKILTKSMIYNLI